MLGKWKGALAIFEPPFAVIDDFGKRLRKHSQQDLRPFAWGVNVYGPELVKTLGRDRLLSAPAWKVEELPWGGIWVQLAQDPLSASAAARRAIEKHLSLKEAFAEPRV